jgi:hypothetical protein
LEGTVSVDGQPLDQGYISFRPQSESPGTAAGGEIVGGKFLMPSQSGAYPGVYRVEITASRPTKNWIPRVGFAAEQYIPPQYNTASQLQAEVKEAGKNLFQFDLQMK